MKPYHLSGILSTCVLVKLEVQKMDLKVQNHPVLFKNRVQSGKFSRPKKIIIIRVASGVFLDFI